jgi:hypothetical protein
LFWSVPSAMAQVSVSIGLPSVNIGINLPLYPELVPVPGYPVYYAPRMDSNYFFYDGMYWVYQEDNWYASSWYNGPWGLVGPEVVPLFVLRIPVRYYRSPPVYFRGWRSDAPPRWGEHWGNQWEQHRRGWDRWNRGSAPARAPLPVYQRQYSADRYPRAEQQVTLRSQNYRYQPRDAVVRQHFQAQAVAPAAPQRTQQGTPQERSSRQQDTQRSTAPAPLQQSSPGAQRPQPPQRGGEDVQRSAPTQASPQRGGDNMQRSAPTQAPSQQRGATAQDQRQQPQPQQGAVQDQSRQPQQGAAQSRQPQQGGVQREQPAPRSSQENNPQGRGASQEPRQGQGQGQGGQGQGQGSDRGKGEDRGQDRNK